MTTERDTSSPQVIVCGGHAEVRFAMSTALQAHELTAAACGTAEVEAHWGERTAVLVVVLTRSLDELDLIARASGRGLRVVAVHGPADVRGAAQARRAGASVLLPRTGRTTPLVDAVREQLRADAVPTAASTVPGLPDQPRPGDVRVVRSPQ